MEAMINYALSFALGCLFMSSIVLIVMGIESWIYYRKRKSKRSKRTGQKAEKSPADKKLVNKI